MSDLQFQSEESAPAPRLSSDEARAVIALWQERRYAQDGMVDLPAVADVAEGLDISLPEAERLVGEVRSRQAQSERQQDQYRQSLLESIQRAEERRQRAELRRERAEWQRQQAEEERQFAQEPRHWHRPGPHLRHPAQMTDESEIPPAELRWLRDPETWESGGEDTKHLSDAQELENLRRVAAIENRALGDYLENYEPAENANWGWLFFWVIIFFLGVVVLTHAMRSQ